MDPMIILLSALAAGGIGASAYFVFRAPLRPVAEEPVDPPEVRSKEYSYKDLKERLERKGMREESHGIFVAPRARSY